MEDPTVGVTPEPAALPDLLPESTEQRLDTVVVGYWMVSGLLGCAFLGGGVLVASWYASQRWPDAGAWTWPLSLVLVGLLLAVTLVMPPLAYARWRFRVARELLTLRSGVIFQEEKAIPVSRLQHVDLLRGPVERLFGLATLVVWTAGNEGASFRLEGLRAERAARLRDEILAARGDDVV